jgi:hypothetical protein
VEACHVVPGPPNIRPHVSRRVGPTSRPIGVEMRAGNEMAKSRECVETTIINCLAAVPSRDFVVAGHQATTMAWWSRRDRFELFVSQAVSRKRPAATQLCEDAEASPLKLFLVVG